MNTNELTIGLDLGDRRHAACVLSASGEILAEELITNTRGVWRSSPGSNVGSEGVLRGLDLQLRFLR